MKIRIDKTELVERAVPDPALKRLYGPDHPWNKRASRAYYRKHGKVNPRLSEQVASDKKRV
jgi:hypothetical protein